MPIAIEPSVFVSSTCYDLSQVRTDLREFIEAIGLCPLLSEFSSFPLNPEAGTLQNCLEVVRNRADLFVLIVGGRYGTQIDSGKSITNLEYLEARAKGIPIYTFVQKSILHTLHVWKQNRNADFHGIVDSPRLFEFVESLHDTKEQWVYPFEKASDITTTLRRQFAFLFKDALAYRAKLKRSGLPDDLQNLSPTALRIAVEKPKAWEYLLFSQIFADELQSAHNLKRDLKYGMCTQSTLRLSDAVDTMSWLSKKGSDFLKLMQSASSLINVALKEALGPEGKPGDAEHLVYVGRRIGDIYREILKWTIEFKAVSVEDELQRAVELASRLSANTIYELEEYSEQMQRKLAEVLAVAAATGETQYFELILKLTAPPMEEYMAEMERIEGLYSM